MKKMGSLVLFSYLLPDLWSLNRQKLCYSCNSLQIFFAFLENDVGYSALS